MTMDTSTIDARKSGARAWFENLRDEICAAFEAVEDAQRGKAVFEQCTALPRCASCAAAVNESVTKPAAASARIIGIRSAVPGS